MVPTGLRVFRSVAVLVLYGLVLLMTPALHEDLDCQPDSASRCQACQVMDHGAVPERAEPVRPAAPVSQPVTLTDVSRAESRPLTDLPTRAPPA